MIVRAGVDAATVDTVMVRVPDVLALVAKVTGAAETGSAHHAWQRKMEE